MIVVTVVAVCVALVVGYRVGFADGQHEMNNKEGLENEL